MSVTVRLVGPRPTIEPCQPVEDRYLLEMEDAVVVRDLLPRFGLEEPGLSFFKNGNLAGMETPIQDGDEIAIILMVMGG